MKDELKAGFSDAIHNIRHGVRYAVYYNPQTCQLRFVVENMNKLRGNAAIYGLSGVCMMQFPIRNKLTCLPCLQMYIALNGKWYDTFREIHEEIIVSGEG